MTSNRQLRQAALGRYREARGWTRDELDEWLGVSATGLAAMSLESMPVYEITEGGGVLYPATTVFVLADRYDASNDRLLAAIRNGDV